MKKVLIIEDDITIAEGIRDFLLIENFDVVIETDGQIGYQLSQSEAFDLILLDVMLPNMTGYEICKLLRPQIDIPILMVTANGADADKIRGLGLGADDYIPKPFSPTELIARIKANLAQYERLKSRDNENPLKKSETLMAGRLTANLSAHRVCVDGREISLKNKEYELLIFLMSNPDIVFSKEHLYERIWGMDAFGDVKTVGVHIGRIRDKIEKDPQNPDHIQTVWGAGYRFKT